MNTTSASTIESLATASADYDAAHGDLDRYEVLDYGAQNVANTGTNGISIADYTYMQVRNLTEDYASYWRAEAQSDGDTSSELHIGLGTNNDNTPTSTKGSSWKTEVSDVDAWLTSHGHSQVVVYGAIDIEPHYSGYTETKAWAESFDSSGSAFSYWNFGSADGCSETVHTGSFVCDDGWTQTDLWYVSWGIASAYPFPETYYADNALQWMQISWFSDVHSGSNMDVLGPVDTYHTDSSTLNSTSAWNDLWTDLNQQAQTAQSLTAGMSVYYES